jgi:hypothetical protein
MKNPGFLSGRGCENAWNATNVEDGPSKSQSAVSISHNWAEIWVKLFWRPWGALGSKPAACSRRLNYSYLASGIHQMTFVTLSTAFSYRVLCIRCKIRVFLTPRHVIIGLTFELVAPALINSVLFCRFFSLLSRISFLFLLRCINPTYFETEI